MKKIHCLIVVSLAFGVIFGGCRSKIEDDSLVTYGLSLMQDGEYESAREVLVEATERFTNNLTAHYNLGLTCWKLGDNKAAVESLTKAVSLCDSGDSKPLELLAYVLIDSGNALGAGKVLAGIDEPTARSLTIMALAAERADSSDLSLSYLGQALELDKNYAPALYNLALLQRDVFDNAREALICYKKFKVAAPDDIRADESVQAFISKRKSAPRDQRSEARDQRSETRDQRPADQQTSSQRPATSDQKEVAELLEKAMLALSRDESDIALITLKSTVSKYPGSADAVWALAELYDNSLGNREKADELYKKFVVMFPNDERSSTAKKKVVAISAASASIPRVSARLEPSENHFMAGLEYYKNQEWDKSIVSYTKGLKLRPKSSLIAYNLGLAYKAKGDLDKAVKAFTLSLHIQPDKVSALYMLGLVEMDRDNNDLALVHLNSLLRIKPDFAKAHYLLGLIYLEENRADMTVVHFERFIYLAPEDGNANQAKTWLDQKQGKRR